LIFVDFIVVSTIKVTGIVFIDESSSNCRKLT